MGTLVRKRRAGGLFAGTLVDARQFEALAEVAEADIVALEVVPERARFQLFLGVDGGIALRKTAAARVRPE